MSKIVYFKNFAIATVCLVVVWLIFAFAVHKYNDYTLSYNLNNNEHYNKIIAQLNNRTDIENLATIRSQALTMPDGEKKADILIKIATIYLNNEIYNEFYKSALYVLKISGLPEYYYLDMHINIAKAMLIDVNSKNQTLFQKILSYPEGNENYATLAKYIFALNAIKNNDYKLAINKINEINAEYIPASLLNEILQTKRKCELILLK